MLAKKLLNPYPCLTTQASVESYFGTTPTPCYVRAAPFVSALSLPDTARPFSPSYPSVNYLPRCDVGSFKNVSLPTVPQQILLVIISLSSTLLQWGPLSRLRQSTPSVEVFRTLSECQLTVPTDWDDIGFRVREVNGHVESHYSLSSGRWTEPQFVTSPYLSIHGMAPGLNYGQQCYEGMKAFRAPGDQKINIFRPAENARRMQHSASFISIPQVPTEVYNKSVHLAVSLNAAFVPPHRTGAAMYIRPLLFGSSAQLGLSPPQEYTFVVFVLPVGVYHGVHPVDALILEDFDRAAPEGTGSVKVGGNYAPVLRHSERARNEGFGITLHLDSKTRSSIDEFSTSGFIGIKQEGQSFTVVVPDSKNVIKSVTSDSVCDIARSLGWQVERREINYSELPSFTEILAAGTAAALVPIKSITMRSQGDAFHYHGSGKGKAEGDTEGEPGPACVKLLEMLKGIQQGKIEDKFGWLEEVKQMTCEGAPGAATNGIKDESNGGMVDKLP